MGKMRSFKQEFTKGRFVLYSMILPPFSCRASNLNPLLIVLIFVFIYLFIIYIA